MTSAGGGRNHRQAASVLCQELTAVQRVLGRCEALAQVTSESPAGARGRKNLSDRKVGSEKFFRVRPPSTWITRPANDSADAGAGDVLCCATPENPGPWALEWPKVGAERGHADAECRGGTRLVTAVRLEDVQRMPRSRHPHRRQIGGRRTRIAGQTHRGQRHPDHVQRNQRDIGVGLDQTQKGLQLADVAGPGTPEEGLGSVGLDLPAPPAPIVVEEGFSEFQDVAAAFSKRGDVDGQDTQAVVQLGTESGGIGQGTVGCGHQADIDGERPVPTDGLEGAFLQDAQQAGLPLPGQVADLVQEQRPAAGEFELALAGLHSGGGPLFDAEEFRLEQRRNQRRATDRQKRSMRPATVPMDRPGDQLLARAALSENQHRPVRRRKPADALAKRRHYVAAADQAIVGGAETWPSPLLGSREGSSPALRPQADGDQARRELEPGLGLRLETLVVFKKRRQRQRLGARDPRDRHRDGVEVEDRTAIGPGWTDQRQCLDGSDLAKGTLEQCEQRRDGDGRAPAGDRLGKGSRHRRPHSTSRTTVAVNAVATNRPGKVCHRETDSQYPDAALLSVGRHNPTPFARGGCTRKCEWPGFCAMPAETLSANGPAPDSDVGNDRGGSIQALIKVLRAGFVCPDVWLEIPTARVPQDWDVKDAREFLHRLELEAVTPERPLLYIDSIRLHEAKRPNVAVLEVASNSGVIMTEPLHLSPAAMAWLDKTQFDSR